MKILTLKRLIGLSAIGGAVYVHKQRNGDWTMASMKDTLRHLLATAADKLGPARAEVRRAPATYVPGAARTRVADESKPRTYGDFTKRTDDPGHH